MAMKRLSDRTGNDPYRLLGTLSPLYDAAVTGRSVLGWAITRLLWSLRAEDVVSYQRFALNAIPGDFSGRLLEVPVGTGALSMPKLTGLRDADIVCVDYSAAMMAAAERRAENGDASNISFLQGDVGNLPFDDDSFDIVLTLNGLAAFPAKDDAFSELHRVLRPGGTLCGCTYVRGRNPRTDRFIRLFMVPRGAFRPPFETLGSLRLRFERDYRSVQLLPVQSIVAFRCEK